MTSRVFRASVLGLSIVLITSTAAGAMPTFLPLISEPHQMLLLGAGLVAGAAACRRRLGK